MPIIRFLLVWGVGFIFSVAAFLMATAIKIPPTNLTALACGCVGMFVGLVIIGKASE